MLVDKNITLKWWEELLESESRLIMWLQKLQVTEIDGYSGNFEANAKWNPYGDRFVEKVFINTARDELMHSNMLIEILKERGCLPLKNQSPTSIYWEEMEKEVTNLREMCAVFYLGERLAAERFEVIAEHKKTPEDIKYFLDRALPDEQYHQKCYGKMAGPDAIAKMRTCHDEIIAKILGKRLK